MKRFLLSLLSVALVSIIMGQDCNQLFISEYIEGTGNNKALEIYNPTNSAISLNDYQLARYDNGAIVPNYVSFPAGTTINAKSVLVVVLDKRNPQGEGQEQPISPELEALADLFLCPVYNVNKMMYFNGNDAVTLEKKSSGALIDIIGKIGENPGFGWNSNEENEFYQTETWDSNHWTYNNTMVRKRTIKKGVSVNPSFFNPSIQWDTLGVNVFTNLRNHDCECGSVDITTPVAATANLLIYPNPVNDQYAFFQSSKNIAKIEIFNAIGQIMIVNTFDNTMAKVAIDVNGLNSGLYIAKVVYDDNTASTRKFQIK